MAKTQGEQILEAIIAKGGGTAATQAASELQAYKKGAKIASVVSAAKPEFVDELSKTANQSIINIDKNISAIRNDQKVTAKGIAENNKLLTSLLKSSSSYYESNNELIKNLLLSKSLSEEKALGGELRSIRKAVTSSTALSSTSATPDGTSNIADALGALGVIGGGALATKAAADAVKGSKKVKAESARPEGPEAKVRKDPILSTEAKTPTLADDIRATRPDAREGSVKTRIQPTIDGKPKFTTIDEAKVINEEEIRRFQSRAKSIELPGPKITPTENLGGGRREPTLSAKPSSETVTVRGRPEPTFGYKPKTAEQLADALKAPTKAEILKSVSGAVAKKSLGAVAKTIPFLAAGFGIYDTIMRSAAGDWTGAGIAALSTGVSFAPGIGGAAAIGLDLTNIARDAYKDAYKVYPEEDTSGKQTERWSEIAAATEEELLKKISEIGGTGGLSQGAPIYDAMGNFTGQYEQPAEPTKVIPRRPEEGGEGSILTPSLSAAPKINQGKIEGISQPSSGGTTIVKGGDTINNVTNNNGGGGAGGSAPSGPVTSTAPKSPWDEPLYGANMGIF